MSIENDLGKNGGLNRCPMDSGWSMVELMDYYALTNREYDRVIASLQEIRKNKK